VLACEECNGSDGKSSMTPPDRFIEKLNERNSDLLGRDKAGLPDRMRMELAEWHGRDLAENVHMLVERCRADGFGEWEIQVMEK